MAKKRSGGRAARGRKGGKTGARKGARKGARGARKMARKGGAKRARGARKGAAKKGAAKKGAAKKGAAKKGARKRPTGRGKGRRPAAPAMPGYEVGAMPLPIETGVGEPGVGRGAEIDFGTGGNDDDTQ